LPWLTGHGSSIVAGVGRDAEYIARHIAANSAQNIAAR
jgi:putative flavoprotein involved in K+ transport